MKEVYMMFYFENGNKMNKYFCALCDYHLLTILHT